MADEFEYNPETGQAEPVKKTAMKRENSEIKVPGHLRFSPFVRPDEKGTFNIVSRVGKDCYFAREMSDELLDSVTEKVADQEELKEKLTKLLKGNDQVAIKKAQQQMLIALKEQRAIYSEILQNTLVGWTLDVEFTIENVRALSTSVRTKIARDILGASQVGANDADFFTLAS